MTTCSYGIVGGDYERAGTASRSLKELLKAVGVDSSATRRLMIAAYEAEMNVVIHAHRGTLTANVDAQGVHVEVADEGPGIRDVDLAMTEGYSTAPAAARALGFGAGLGLPNIRRNSDHFAIISDLSKGTTVRFGVACVGEKIFAPGASSMRVRGERCRQCLQCIHACPTTALRLQRGAPHLLMHRCVECTVCIARCPSGSFDIDAPNSLPPSEGPLVVPAAFFCQFPGFTPFQVMRALSDLGYADVRSTGAYELAVFEAALDAAGNWLSCQPVIVPSCPAVVALVEIRFPSLIGHLAPLLSPIETAIRDAGINGSAVVVCPSQRTALLIGGLAPDRVFAPSALRTALMPLLRGRPGPYTDIAPTASDCIAPTPRTDVLRVHGIADVMRTLDDLENGLLGDLRVLDLHACEPSCFGSALIGATSRAYALHRWLASPIADRLARARLRDRPFAPRPGLRLDPDMSKAIVKLEQIDEVLQSLPGRDCGLCGAPTCRAFAEDVVLERVSKRACTVTTRTEVAKP
jgi:anti-sigma regulatory factor (Ser/Thr protein kinase)/Fe-S-cluster-containing hydrogenase component 2